MDSHDKLKKLGCTPEQLGRLHPFAARSILEQGLHRHTRSLSLVFDNATEASVTDSLLAEGPNDFYCYGTTFNIQRNPQYFAGSVLKEQSDKNFMLTSGIRGTLEVDDDDLFGHSFRISDRPLPLLGLLGSPFAPEPDFYEGKWNWPMREHSRITATLTQQQLLPPGPVGAYPITVDIIFLGLRFANRCWNKWQYDDTVALLESYGVMCLAGRGLGADAGKR